MNAPRTIEIDGFTYTLGRLTPTRALKLQNRLIRALGPGLVALITAVPRKGDSLDLEKLNLGALGPAMQALFANLTPEEQDGIMRELLSTVVVTTEGKGGPVMPMFDAHFDGRLPAVFKLCWAAAEANFSDFTAPLAAYARAAMGLVARSRASSTSQPSGPSGG